MTLVNPFVNASVKSTFVVGSATALLSVVTSYGLSLLYKS